jgi:hypothetical protein
MLIAISCGWFVPKSRPIGQWNVEETSGVRRPGPARGGGSCRLCVAADDADEGKIPLGERAPQDRPVGGMAHRHDDEIGLSSAKRGDDVLGGPGVDRRQVC